VPSRLELDAERGYIDLLLQVFLLMTPNKLLSMITNLLHPKNIQRLLYNFTGVTYIQLSKSKELVHKNSQIEK
jgi:hypothetical protein